jgi:hypothetical protein
VRCDNPKGYRRLVLQMLYGLRSSSRLVDELARPASYLRRSRRSCCASRRRNIFDPSGSRTRVPHVREREGRFHKESNRLLLRVTEARNSRSDKGLIHSPSITERQALIPTNGADLALGWHHPRARRGADSADSEPLPQERERPDDVCPPVSKLSTSALQSVHQESHCPPVFAALVVKVVVSASRARSGDRRIR